MFGAVEFSPGGDVYQEVPGVVAGGFSAGEGGGQGGPGGVGEDAVGVVGDGLSHGVLEAFGGLGAWGMSAEVRQDGLGGLAVALLQVAEGFLGRCCLLLVATLFVPLGSGASQVQGGEDHGDGQAARNVGGVGEFLGGLA
ncbi:hypothetical protein AOB60_34230 [Streptomyces noursei]|uniref:Uncharacterized protein n=1 Tax=Streptomyces noursei TaxID=1971 RepID=A0A2N8PD89_STRNR|nr:hypothetical protein AOB60_34230 [Streptomyces noursei]